MIVAFDTGVLAAALHPGARLPRGTRQPRERVGVMVQALEQKGATIIVPTPALSEFLVFAGGEFRRYLDEISGRSVFQVQPFDAAAALEAAMATRLALDRGDKKSGAQGPWQKVKVDRQIVAVARVHGAETLYSDDSDVRVLGTESGIRVVNTGELPLPHRMLEP